MIKDKCYEDIETLYNSINLYNDYINEILNDNYFLIYLIVIEFVVLFLFGLVQCYVYKRKKRYVDIRGDYKRGLELGLIKKKKKPSRKISLSSSLINRIKEE
jgi:hypothetical protein